MGNGQVFISEDAHSKNPRTALKKGDVIVSTVGTIGNCAVVDESVLPANSDRHVGIIRIQRDFSPYFLSTFLLSKYGKFQTLRESTGNVQLNLFLYKIRELIVPYLNVDFQIKIESVVKNAHSKLEQSKSVYSQAETLLLNALGMVDFSPSTENINIKSFKDSFIATGRLDAEYYQPKYDELEHKIKNYTPSHSHAARGNEEDYVTTIGREYDLVKSTSKRDKQAYNYIEIGDVDVSNGMATFNKIDVNELPDNAKQEVKTGDLLISKVRPNRGAVTIIDFDDTNLIVSGAFTVLREKEDSEFLNETLKVLLRTKIYRDWLLKFNVGTQYPVIRDEDILNLPIPKIDRETQNQIATLIQQSFTLKSESEDLLATAKRAVEIAIETNEQTALAYINNQIG